jgi:hypothetical protein
MYRQFTALFEVLKRTGAVNTAANNIVNFPVKASKRRPKTTSREYDAKVTSFSSVPLIY